jgi:hypothetical protein
MRIIGYWEEKKEKLKRKYPVITDEDLNYFEGKEREMIEQLSYKLGTTKEELSMIIERLD